FIAAAILLIGLALPGPASAFVSGQQSLFTKEWGNSREKFFDPEMLGVDANNGDVYVGNVAPDFSSLRVQKFSEDGPFAGETAALARGSSNKLIGIAVNHAAGEFYVLETEEIENPTTTAQESAAKRILAFQTTPNGSGELIPATVPVLPVPTG